MTGAEEIRRLAYENSINPRLLLAILDYESRWVHGQPVDAMHTDYPMGYLNLFYKGMFSQMVWAVNQLSIGYYGWRTGTVITELEFPDGTHLRLDPRLNAGTVALQYLFVEVARAVAMVPDDRSEEWIPRHVHSDVWRSMGTWRHVLIPCFRRDSRSRQLSLPFEPKTEWSLTGGPHGAWEHDGSLAAIDFAPSTDHGGCDPTPTWVTASAAGLDRALGTRCRHRGSGRRRLRTDGLGPGLPAHRRLMAACRREPTSKRTIISGMPPAKAAWRRGPTALCPQVQRRMGRCRRSDAVRAGRLDRA